MVDLTVEDRRSPVVATAIAVRVRVARSVHLSIQRVVHVIQRCAKVLSRGQFRTGPELTELRVGRRGAEDTAQDVVHFVV